MSRLLKADFEITVEDDYVRVKSEIIDQEITKAVTADDVKKLKKQARQHTQKTSRQADLCSECSYTVNLDFDEDKQVLIMTLKSSCESKIPLDVFKEACNEVSKGFN